MDRLEEMGLVGDVLAMGHRFVEGHHGVRDRPGSLDCEHACDRLLCLSEFHRGGGAVCLCPRPAGEEGSRGGRLRGALGGRGSLGRGREEDGQRERDRKGT